MKEVLFTEKQIEAHYNLLSFKEKVSVSNAASGLMQTINSGNTKSFKFPLYFDCLALALGYKKVKENAYRKK